MFNFRMRKLNKFYCKFQQMISISDSKPNYDSSADYIRNVFDELTPTYRPLTSQEIELLKSQGCTSSEWEGVKISPATELKYVRSTRFSGQVRIGTFTAGFVMPGGLHKHSGIFYANLHNVVIGNDCCVENVKNYMANYIVGDNSFIENVDILLVDGASAFGNGVDVSVLNETGGREVTIHNHLTVHEAYIEAMYRHRTDAVKRLKEIANRYAEEHTSPIGKIGRNVTIVDTGYIKNVNIGDFCSIEGAGRLKNGTINSNESAPVHIGYGVVLDDFIIQSGCSVEDGTMMARCYLGQSCKMGHTYSASDSLFFSNCQGENGEACAIFAGPFTVTHHKSTLLIAGLFSFMNAGSGSNQSNHMYKLGPIHQGAMERGAKTTSDSYILWPARIGAFSLVMGRHVGHVDTSDMPFSYLIEQQGMTYLVPAINLKSVGTIRDAQKWPRRDGRKDPHLMDQINYNLLSPYTMQKALRGISVLKQLRSISGVTSETYTYHSAKITSRSLERGLTLYDMAIVKFLGNSVINRLMSGEFSNVEEMLSLLKPTHPAGLGEWVDLLGLIAPKSEVDKLINDVEDGKINDVHQLNSRFRELHGDYYDMEWTWAYDVMLDYFGIKEDLTPEKLIEIVENWKEAVVNLDKMIYADAKKEFSLTSKTGFGADGTSFEMEKDFEQVRGDFENNSFVQATLNHIKEKTELGDRAIAKLRTVIN